MRKYLIITLFQRLNTLSIRQSIRKRQRGSFRIASLAG